MAVAALGPSLFVRDFAMGHLAGGGSLVSASFVSHHSSAFLRVVRLIDFETQLTVFFLDILLPVYFYPLTPSDFCW
jgi:hypothetical protein